MWKCIFYDRRQCGVINIEFPSLNSCEQKAVHCVRARKRTSCPVSIHGTSLSSQPRFLWYNIDKVFSLWACLAGKWSQQGLQKLLFFHSWWESSFSHIGTLFYLKIRSYSGKSDKLGFRRVVCTSHITRHVTTVWSRLEFPQVLNSVSNRYREPRALWLHSYLLHALHWNPSQGAHFPSCFLSLTLSPYSLVGREVILGFSSSFRWGVLIFPLFPSSVSWLHRVSSSPLRLNLCSLANLPSACRLRPRTRSPQADTLHLGSCWAISSNKTTYIWERSSAPMRRVRGQCPRSFPQREREVEPSQGPLPDLKPTWDPLPLSGNWEPHPPKRSLSPWPLLSMPILFGWTGDDRASRRRGWMDGWPLCPRRGQGTQRLREHQARCRSHSQSIHSETPALWPLNCYVRHQP